VLVTWLMMGVVQVDSKTSVNFIDFNLSAGNFGDK